MPQVRNQKVLRARNDLPFGRGSPHYAAFDAGLIIRQRAEKINKEETNRLEKAQRQIDRNIRKFNSIHDRVVERTNKSLKHTETYRDILFFDYPMKNFRSLQTRPQYNPYMAPDTTRRLETEEKIYTYGFRRTLKPEVEFRLSLNENNDPRKDPRNHRWKDKNIPHTWTRL